MEKYINRTAIILYLNLLIGLIHILHEFEILDFIPDILLYNSNIIFIHINRWNGLLILDKNK